MNKKGQAAMEFLMTYGWAILAAVIVIAVLAVFGVFNPSTYVPNQFVISAPFGPVAGIANASGVTLEIRNGAGETLSVYNVSVVGCGSNSAQVNVSADSVTQVTVGCTPAAGKFKGDVSITYRKAGSNLDLTSSGSIVSKVA